MYRIFPTKDFGRSLHRLRRSGRFNESLLEDALELLSMGVPMPAKYKDHALDGDLQNLRLCHLRGDLILQYKRNEETGMIILDDIGSHHELLGR